MYYWCSLVWQRSGNLILISIDFDSFFVSLFSDTFEKTYRTKLEIVFHQHINTSSFIKKNTFMSLVQLSYLMGHTLLCWIKLLFTVQIGL